MESAFGTFKEIAFGIGLGVSIALLTLLVNFCLFRAEGYFHLPENILYNFFKLGLDVLGYGGSLILVFNYTRAGITKHKLKEDIIIAELRSRLPKSQAHRRGKK